MSQSSNQNRILIEGALHVLFWLVAIHFYFDIVGLIHSFDQLLVSKDTMKVDEALILLPVSILLFYWNVNFLVPNLLASGKWIKYTLGLVSSYVIACFLVVGICELLLLFGFNFFLSIGNISDFSVEILMQILIASTVLGVGKLAYKNWSLRKEAEKKQKEAEFKYLTQQFNPHFLHNTLNAIYSNAIEEDAPKTQEAILMLSEMMRYPIQQGLHPEVLLTDELLFVENYIALQRLRLGEDYPIDLRVSGDLEEVRTLPLSLIVLVENAFKYGVSTKSRSPIHFVLDRKDNHIVFTTQNESKNEESVTSHKLGMKNLQERLRLFYGDQFDLEVAQEGKLYRTILRMKVV